MIGDTLRASALDGFRVAGRGVLVTFDYHDEGEAFGTWMRFFCEGR